MIVFVSISCDIWYEYKLVWLKRDAFLCRLLRYLGAAKCYWHVFNPKANINTRKQLIIHFIALSHSFSTSTFFILFLYFSKAIESSHFLTRSTTQVSSYLYLYEEKIRLFSVDFAYTAAVDAAAAAAFAVVDSCFAVSIRNNWSLNFTK